MTQNLHGPGPAGGAQRPTEGRDAGARQLGRGWAIGCHGWLVMVINKGNRLRDTMCLIDLLP